SPASTTGCQECAWQFGHSSRGGMESSPHAPQRMAVSGPARAFSKNARAVIAGSVTTEEAHQDRRRVAAERVGEALARAVDLTGAGLAAELRDDLRDLRGARRADRVALGVPPAR